MSQDNLVVVKNLTEKMSYHLRLANLVGTHPRLRERNLAIAAELSRDIQGMMAVAFPTTPKGWDKV